MKGDFTWLRFDRQKHYRGVLMQQGRVQLDSDWNEQVLLAEYRYASFLGDFIGPSGAPTQNAMALSFDGSKKALRLSVGRYYVGGLLAENDAEQAYPLPAAGWSLAYLDVWSGHVTAAQDPDLREPALGGPDTATRICTQWALRSHALGTPNAAALDAIRKKYRGTWPVLPAPSIADCWQMPLGSGRMTVANTQVAQADSRLYRVEVHSGSTDDAGVAQKLRFKWSRDNASALAPVASIDATSKTLTLQDTGLAVQNAFGGVAWVEISDALCAASGAPGYLVAVDASPLRDGKLLLQESWQYARPPEQLQTPILVRRWDGSETKTAFTLDGGLKVGFDDGQYRSGDYWLIPVRQNMVLGWADNVPQAAHGTEHRYAALALVDAAGNVESLASVFQPLTTGHVSKKGDTVDGDLAVLGRLSVGSNVFRGPLTLAAAADGLLASFGSRGGAEAWRISQSNGAAPSLNITDAVGKGLTIASGGNVGIGIGTATPNARLDVTGGSIVWGSGSTLQANQGGSIELWGDPALDDPGANLGRPYIDFHCNGRSTANQAKDFDARIINDAVGRLSVSAPTVYLDGNVGIGTANPEAGNTLQVEGNVHVNGHSIFLREGAKDQFDVVCWDKTDDRVNVGGYNGVNLCFTGKGSKPKLTPVFSVDSDGSTRFIGREKTQNPVQTLTSHSMLFERNNLNSAFLTITDEYNFVGFVRTVEIPKEFEFVATNIRATTKNFEIPHPLDQQRRLVHSCLEGPECGVFYRGQGVLVGGEASIRLPGYFEALTAIAGRTVQLTPIFERGQPVCALAASAVSNGGFDVVAIGEANPQQAFYWEVKAVRSDVPALDVEPAKRG